MTCRLLIYKRTVSGDSANPPLSRATDVERCRPRVGASASPAVPIGGGRVFTSPAVGFSPRLPRREASND